MMKSMTLAAAVLTVSFAAAGCQNDPAHMSTTGPNATPTNSQYNGAVDSTGASSGRTYNAGSTNSAGPMNGTGGTAGPGTGGTTPTGGGLNGPTIR